MEGLSHAWLQCGFAKLSLEKLTYPDLKSVRLFKIHREEKLFFLRLSINSSKQVSNILYALISLIENDVCLRKSVSYFAKLLPMTLLCVVIENSRSLNEFK